MEPDDSSDTLLNRLAQLELLVQIQKEEIRRLALERDLFAAWYDATKAIPARPRRVNAPAPRAASPVSPARPDTEAACAPLP